MISISVHSESQIITGSSAHGKVFFKIHGMLNEKLRNKQRCELRPGDARLVVVGRVDAREGFEHPLEPWQRQPLQVGEAQQPFFSWRPIYRCALRLAPQIGG